MDDKMKSNNKKSPLKNDEHITTSNIINLPVESFVTDNEKSDIIDNNNKTIIDQIFSSDFQTLNDSDDGVFFLKECLADNGTVLSNAQNNLHFNAKTNLPLNTPNNLAPTSQINLPTTAFDNFNGMTVAPVDIFADLTQLPPLSNGGGIGDSMLDLDDDEDYYNEEDIDVIFQGVLSKTDENTTSAPLPSFNTNMPNVHSSNSISSRPLQPPPPQKYHNKLTTVTTDVSNAFLKLVSANKGSNFMTPAASTTTTTLGPPTILPLLPPPLMATSNNFIIETGGSSNNSMETQMPDTTTMVDDEDDDIETDDHTKRLSTFSDYKPAKFKYGKPHPDQVVETSSMAVVEPPDISYELQLINEVLDAGSLSSLQLEAICYACQRHETLLDGGERAAFFIGDGPGVGKGRIIAGIIHENKLCGREKAVWLSVSSDLRFDAIRDLTDVQCNLNVIPLNKVSYNEYISDYEGYAEDGALFCTYSSLIGVCNSSAAIFRSRLEQIVDWCGSDFDGVLVFDECHKAKNLTPVPGGKSTKTSLAVLEIQKRLPNARVVYCSATGATEPKNLGYMYRLGLWGPGSPFPQLQDFIRAVEKRGVGGMEIVAMDMKLRGMYIARQLSFQGVSFRIHEVKLEPSFKSVYNKSVALWNKIYSYSEKAVTMSGMSSKNGAFFWAKFWSFHQRFFKYLCIASKVNSIVELTRNSLKSNKCVIIGLQSTGESHISENDCNLERIVSTASGVLTALIEKSFPVPLEMAGSFNDNNNNNSSGGGGGGNSIQQRNYNNNKMKRSIQKLIKSDNEDDFIDVDEDVIVVGDDDDDDDYDDDDVEMSPPIASMSYPFFNSKKSKFTTANDSITTTKMDKTSAAAASSSVAVGENDILAAAGLPSCKYSWGCANNLTKAVAKENLNLSPAQMCVRWRQELLDDIDNLSNELPVNTLDELIDKLGGVNQVAEMTGRKGRIVKVREDFYCYKLRNDDELPLEYVNISERSKFMGGDKLVAIISEAASAGISLQADKRCANQRKRVHITLELPWSADKAVQQFGRSHRSNQLYPPEYVFVISELAGEKRFASSVAKRLESLGALTHGDRRAGETRDLSQYNFENKFGRMALDCMVNCLTNRFLPDNIPMPNYDSTRNFFNDALDALRTSGLSVLLKNSSYNSMMDGGSGSSAYGGGGDSSNASRKSTTKISRFLNRLLGIQVDLQNAIFSLYTSLLALIIKNQKKAGKWDSGILDWGVTGEKVLINETNKFTIHSKSSDSTVELCQIFIERGNDWNEINNLIHSSNTHDGDDEGDGFYAIDRYKHLRSLIYVKKVQSSSLMNRNAYNTTTERDDNNNNNGSDQLYNIYRPNLGESAKTETLENIQKRYSIIDKDSAEHLWNTQYHGSLDMCTHLFRWGKCAAVARRAQCDHGKRRKVVYIISGAIFGTWNILESVFGESQIRIVRVSTCDGARKVGIIVQTHLVDMLKCRLHQASSNSFQANKMSS